MAYSGGTGTQLDPYLIGTPDDLNNVRNNRTSYFLQINDIDMNISPYNTGTGWSPFGVYNSGTSFRGYYSGGGFKIKNLYINSGDNVSLFGHLTDNAFVGIENIHLYNVNITGGNNVAGLISGCNDSYKFNGKIIKNCSVTGSINGTGTTGGLIGLTQRLGYENCSSECTITGGSLTGGFCGYISSSNVAQCSSKCNITNSGDYCGGFSGRIYASTLSQCIADCTINGYNYVGGFVGFSNISNHTNCYSNGTAIASRVSSSNNIAGYDGQALATNYTNCYSTVSISTNASHKGGFLYSPFNDCTITNCYYDTTICPVDHIYGQIDAISKTTAELKQVSTFNTWEFTTIWGIIEGSVYPFLRWYTPLPPSNNPYPYLRWYATQQSLLDTKLRQYYDTASGTWKQYYFIKYWNGSTWVYNAPPKVWNGTEFL